jgi:putative cell wall-binding protein
MGVLADPLPSAGLVWAYDAPLFLVNPNAPTPVVNAAIQEISASSGATVTVHVVGGTTALPQARIDEIEAAVAGPLEIDRLRTDGDRFDMAATIAERVGDEWESRNGTGTAPERVLLANGFDQNAFFDALALSAVSASEGYPILLLKKDEVPTATDAALTSIDPTETIVAGGPVVVSNALVSSLGATRWWGADRYETAVDIAENAVARGWLERKLVGISASLPDALGDGGPLGRQDGISLLTRADTLSPATKAWLETYGDEVEDCFIFGGPVAVSPEVKAQVEDALKW